MWLIIKAQVLSLCSLSLSHNAISCIMRCSLQFVQCTALRGSVIPRWLFRAAPINIKFFWIISQSCRNMFVLDFIIFI